MQDWSAFLPDDYDYYDEIERKALSVGQDPYTMDLLAKTESNMNPNAVSPAGAQGMFQIMPDTGRDLGLQNPFSPTQNINAGVDYFDQMSDKYGGNPALADAAYNWGPGNLDKLISKAGTDDLGTLYPQMPGETQNHLANVLRPFTGDVEDLDRIMPDGSSSPYAALPDAPNVGQYAKKEMADAATPSTDLRQRQLAELADDQSGINSQKADALRALSETGGIGGENALAIALTAIIPTLLGLGFKGMKGAAAGAQAGAAGAGVGLAGLTEQMKTRDAANKLAYTDLKTQETAQNAERRAVLAARAKRQDEVSDLGVTESGKDRRAGVMAKAMSKPDAGGVALDAETKKDIRNRATVAASGRDVINFVERVTPDLMKEQYRNPDGSIDWAGTADILTTRAGKLAGPESDIGRATQKIEQFITQYTNAMSGLAMTDKEFARLYGQLYEKGVMGGQLLPTSIPVAMTVIDEFIQKQRLLAINDVSAMRAANAGTEEAVGRFFDQLSTTDLPTGGGSSDPLAGAMDTGKRDSQGRRILTRK